MKLKKPICKMSEEDSRAMAAAHAGTRSTKTKKTKTQKAAGKTGCKKTTTKKRKR